MKKKLASRKFSRWFFKSLPLIAIISASSLHIPRVGQQFLVLVVLLWLQVFLLEESYHARRE
jgi:hypothetical protein